MDDRLYPSRPIPAASLALVREGRVLIARRAGPPLKGVYALPGGAVEVGETVRQAAAREFFEETGLAVEPETFLDHVEPIVREGERVKAHFVISVFAAHWRAGEPQISDELDAYAWVSAEEVGGFETTPELPRIVALALKWDGAGR